MKIVKVAHHRNGVGGESFYVVLFRDKAAGPNIMVAVVFETPGQCAVLDTVQTVGLNIGFAEGNSWRGDEYESGLRAAIAEWEQARQAEFEVRL
jgi:hypothetical protein